MIALLPPAPREADARERNTRLLSILRWLAIFGQLATVLLVGAVLHVPLPLAPMLGAIAALAALNLVIAQVAARRAVGDAVLFATLLADVACLTVQLYLAGGLGNPFVSLYLLQVVIAAVLLPTWASIALVLLTSGLFAWLALSPSRLPLSVGARLSLPYEVAAWVSYALAASLLVLFVTRIVRNLAEREARLAALRQRAAEEEHIVRLGLLASGAAHELGTPLASVAVMLGDWSREPVIANDRDLAADVAAMAGEVARCKAILGQVLLSAGEVRGDAPVRTTLRQFVRETIAAWQATNTVPVALDDVAAVETAIVADRPLAQSLVNLLDNAVEAGASTISVRLTLDGGTARLIIRDDGHGFPEAMLADIGKPYRSTKARAGAGLGLFLVSNVLRTLGGSICAINRDRGAEVILSWPIAALLVTE